MGEMKNKWLWPESNNDKRTVKKKNEWLESMRHCMNG